MLRQSIRDLIALWKNGQKMFVVLSVLNVVVWLTGLSLMVLFGHYGNA